VVLRACATFVLAALVATAAHAQMSLYTAVDLARRNSSSVRIAQADVAKAEASLSETRDVYVPSLTAGSSAGYSYGFLGGVPSVFNAQIQSLVISFSQPDYIRAARAGLHTAMLSLEDALDQVELDSALDYLQLNSITEQLAALEEQKQFAERLHSIEQARLSAGLESEIAATRAELTIAQTDLKRLDLEAQASLLRKRLSDLTGLPESEIRTDARTVPPAPVNDGAIPSSFTAAVDAGYSNAVAKHYLAHGDARQNYRPQIGFAFTYDFLDTTLNNYNLYYSQKQPLRPNNFGIAAQVSLPLFNAAQSAHARGAAADAVHADAQAARGRQVAEENTVQLRAGLAELRAQSRIADLQATLAEQNVNVVHLQLGQAPVSSTPLTPADEMQARINERARYSEAVDARFELLKAQLSLLRVTGGIHTWVNSTPH
jgi:outer membrane protein TolC